MAVFVWLIVGGILGWITSMIMRTDSQPGIGPNIAVGIAGAFLGGWLLRPVFGVSTLNQDNFSVGGMLVALLGAVILLAGVNLFRRGTAR